jgi:hypothetical protein
MQLSRSVPAPLLLCLALVACSSGATPGAAPAKTPSRSGDLLEVASPEDRATAPGAVLAFVNGLHTVVVDGKDAYAGQMRLTGASTDSGLALPLPGSLTATLVPAGDGFQLTFSSGESVAMHRRAK